MKSHFISHPSLPRHNSPENRVSGSTRFFSGLSQKRLCSTVLPCPGQHEPGQVSRSSRSTSSEMTLRLAPISLACVASYVGPQANSTTRAVSKSSRCRDPHPSMGFSTDHTADRQQLPTLCRLQVERSYFWWCFSGDCTVGRPF